MSRKRIISEDMPDARKFSRIELALELLIEENKQLRRKVGKQEKALSTLLSGHRDVESGAPLRQVH